MHSLTQKNDIKSNEIYEKFDQVAYIPSYDENIPNLTPEERKFQKLEKLRQFFIKNSLQPVEDYRGASMSQEGMKFLDRVETGGARYLNNIYDIDINNQVPYQVKIGNNQTDGKWTIGPGITVNVEEGEQALYDRINNALGLQGE